jgi:hypothetical protein
MVVEEINKMGYLIPEFTAQGDIIAASPNHKKTDRYRGYRNKYRWIKSSGLHAEFQLLEVDAPDQALGS